jgi:MFS family permease
MVFFIIGPPGLLLSLLMLTVAEPLRRGAGSAARIPLSEVLKFMRRSRGTIACHNIGSGFVFLSAYSETAWVPTFFIRHHHWSAALTGEVYGLIAAIFGASGVAYGGFLADRLAARGHRDACMRVMLLSSLLWFPTGIAFLLVPSAVLSAVLLAPTVFIVLMFYGVAPAALMEITPARMRGQAGALYIFVATLIGLLIGPTSVALITDYVFHDDNMVGYSLLIVTVIAHLLSAAFFWAGLKPFIRSRDRLNDLAVAAAS